MNCLAWSRLENCYVLACIDDLCHGSSTTLCGLEEGYDFGEAWDDDEDYGDYEEDN